MVHDLTRRQLLGSAAGGGATLAAVILGAGTTSLVHADEHDDEKPYRVPFVFEVKPDLTSFDFTRDIVPGDVFPTGPFYVQGSAFVEGTLPPPEEVPPAGTEPTEEPEPIGVFRSWGWIHDGVTGAAVVSQSLEFEELGNLQLQGLQGEPVAVVGGTGQFRNVRGEGSYEMINEDQMTFRLRFKLLGAGGGLWIV